MGRPEDPKKKPQAKKSRLSQLKDGVPESDLPASGRWRLVPNVVWERIAILLDQGVMISLGKSRDGGAISIYIRDGDDELKRWGTATTIDGELDPIMAVYDPGDP